MIEIKDITGLSEPLKKLIEVIAEGIGGISRPILSKKNADAKAYEIRTIAQAIADSQKLLGPISYSNGIVTVEAAESDSMEAFPDTPLEKRLIARMAYQEAKRQSNVESITQYAAEELGAEESVSQEKLDSDWISRFFRISEDITTEMMHRLWGKVLAGEAKRPGSYSLRTLDILKNIGQVDAELFVRFSRYAITEESKVFVINPDNGKYLKEKLGFSFVDYLRLRELGLLVPVDLRLTLPPALQPARNLFTCGSTAILIERPQGSPQINLEVICYTDVGQQLLQLVENAPADIGYLQKFASFLRHTDVLIQVGNILAWNEGAISDSDLWTPLPDQEHVHLHNGPAGGDNCA